jgi:hypothetical protein
MKKPILIQIAIRKQREHDATMRAIAAAHKAVAERRS